MSEFTKYVTRTGDRLDTIAYAVYGDALRWDEILSSNPELPILSEYDAGLELKIPILQDLQLNDINTAPWK